MGKYVVLYRGGSAPSDPAEQKASMDRWMGWFKELGGDVVDEGNPFTVGKAVSKGGSVADASSGVSGYSIIKADSLDAAVGKAKDCPIFQDGGSVEVFETMSM